MKRSGRGRAEQETAGKRALKASVDSAKRKAVEKVLARTGGNVAAAAAMLGVVRPSLYRIMKRYGITTGNGTKGRRPA